MSVFCRRLLSAVVVLLGAAWGRDGARGTSRSGASVIGVAAFRSGRFGAARYARAHTRPAWFARVGIALVGVSAAVLGFASAPAVAAIQHPYLSQLTGFSASAYSVAVDDQSGDTLVADSGPDVVKVFNSSGVLTATWTGSAASNPPGTPSGSFGGGQVTVAANNTTGDVYVTDSSHAVVDILSSTGAYLRQLTGATFSNPRGIAVDQATGSIYVADPGAGVVDVFNSAGAFTGTLTGQGFSNAFSVAVDDKTGEVLVADSGAHVVYVFSAATGAFQSTWSGSASSNPPGTVAGSFGSGQVAVAADNATGDVFVADSPDNVADELSGAGDYVGQTTGTPSGAFSFPNGVAVDQASGDLYVADPSRGEVDVFGPGVVVPDVTTGQPSNLAGTSVTLNGTVNADSTSVSSCQFQYLAAADYNPAATDPFSGAPTAGCAATPSGSSPVAVSANVSGLTPDTLYYYRLEASNDNGTNTGVTDSFVAPGTSAGPAPTVGAEGLSDGRVYEQVSPVNKDGLTAGAQPGVAPAPTAPVYTLASADGNAVFETDLLTAGSNGYGLQTFPLFQRSATGWSTTGLMPPQNAEPDLISQPRVSELLSSDLSEAAVGTELSFGSAPANAVDLVGAGGSFSWLSKPLVSDPFAPNTPFKTPWVVGGSQDLSTVYFGYGGTLVPSDDQGNPAFGGASRRSVLNTGAVSDGLYEWTASGGLKYAAVLPNGSVDPYGASLSAYGSNAQDINANPTNFATHPVSSDGSRLFFVSPDPFDTAAPASDPVELYVRETAADGSQRTVLVSASALTGRPAADSPVSVDRPGFCFDCGSYSYASADGSRVFFEDVDQLTSNAPNDSTIKEYEFDTDTNTLTYLPGVAGESASETSPILASTTDGSELLFLKEAPGGDSLDLWSGGTVTPVAQFPVTCQTIGFDTRCGVPAARMSTDGSVVVFETDEPIYTTVPGEFNNAGGFEQVYRYVTATGQLTCLSCGSAGLQHAGDASMTNDDADSSGGTVPQGLAIGDSRGISSDGGRVFFDSPDPLVPQAVNGQRNVYEWEAAGDGSCPSSAAGGCLYLISSGQSSSQDFFLDNSANGNDVFFATEQGLVPQDTTADYDVYDARVGGGFPTQSGPAACSGDACQAPASGAPALPTAATVSFSGPGDTAQTATHGKPRVLTRTVRGTSFLVRVSVPGKGAITVSGTGVQTAKRSVSSGGTYAVRVTLAGSDKRLLARRRAVRVMLQVSYAPPGSSADRARGAVTVKPSVRHARQAGSKRGSAR